MKNYYFILGVSIYAKESEIKRAYRKLALKFHPDKNSDPDAETVFKELNEAYEVLSDMPRKFLYDQMLVGVEPTPTPTTSTHRDPRYRPKPPGYAFKTDSNRKQLLDLMNRNLPYAVMISRITLFFCSVLVLDLLLPMKSNEVTIVNLTGVYGSNGLEYERVETSDGKKYRIRKGLLKKIDSNHEISVMTSRLLAVPVKLRDNVSNAVYRLYVSIYGNFIFFPCIWVITSLMGVFYERGIEFRFNLGIVNALLTIFNLVILLISF